MADRTQPIADEVLAGPRFLTPPLSHLRLGWRGVAAIVALACATTLVACSVAGPLTDGEQSTLATARKMLATGNWLATADDHAPPLPVWSVAVLAKLFPALDEQWLVRMPGGFALGAAVLILAACVARWHGNRLAIVTGLVYLGSVGFLSGAGLAPRTGLITLWVTAALALFALAQVDHPRGRCTQRWLPWLFQALVGVAFLTTLGRGPVAIMVVCGSYLIVQQQWRGFRMLLAPVPQAFCGLTMAAWLVPVGLADRWKVAELVIPGMAPAVATAAGAAPPALATLLWNLLPWTPLAAWGAWRLFVTGVLTQPFWRLVAAWIVPCVVLLSLGANSQPGATVPLMAPLSMLAAYGIEDLWRRRLRRLKRRGRVERSTGSTAQATAHELAPPHARWPQEPGADDRPGPTADRGRSISAP